MPEDWSDGGRSYLDAAAGTDFISGRSHQITPPPMTRKIEISCVPVIIRRTLTRCQDRRE